MLTDDSPTMILPPVPLPFPPPASRQGAVVWARVNTFGTLALWTWALIDAARALWSLG